MNRSSSLSVYFGCDEFSKGWAAIALFGSLTTIFIACFYTFLRLGLETPVSLVPGCVAVEMAAFLSPLLVPARRFSASISARAVIYPLVVVAVFASVLLALWCGRWIMAIYVVLAAFGFVRAVLLVRNASARDLTLLVAASAGTAIYLFVVVHNLGYAGVYTPEQGLLGLLNHDTRFHSAIAFMVQNFHEPSLGLDGVVALRYHFGSHFWFAALGAMTGAKPLWSYGAGVP